MRDPKVPHAPRRMFSRAAHLAVPPRELAATITAMAVLRAGWAVSSVLLAVSFIIWVSLWIDRGYDFRAALPLGALVALSLVLVGLIRQPSIGRGILFLSVGAVANFAWVCGVLALDSTMNGQGIYLVNRLVVVLILIGAVSSRLIYGVFWCTAGWAMGTLGVTLAQTTLGLEINTGYAPLAALAVYLIIIGMFLFIRKSQRRFGSGFSANLIEPARITGQRELEERAVALIHDTILNDLASITHGASRLDERTRKRFRDDIDLVSETRSSPESAEVSAASWLRHEILAAVSDYRWLGLRVDISGDAPISERPCPKVAEALTGAIRSCLDNVAKHSSSDSAELFMDFSPTELSVMIVDRGTGFDVDAVPKDRLGIRHSVIQRIEHVGGNVKIWSSADAGTSVVIVVPLEGDDG